LPVSILTYIDLETPCVCAEPSYGMMLVSNNLSLSSQPRHVVGCVLLILVVHCKVWKTHITQSPVSLASEMFQLSMLNYIDRISAETD
jgi:hypothetical protein